MTITAHYIPEPLLEFGSGQKVEHPQDGLFLYGPVDSSDKPAVIRVGVIGTVAGIDLVKVWLKQLTGRMPVRNPEKLHTSPWPGFQAAFGARVDTEPLW
jgi:hypothetical protein